MPNTFKILSKWRNFAKSGHTDCSALGPQNETSIRTHFFAQPRCSVMISVTRLGNLLDLGNFLKPLATIILPESPTFLGNYCKGVKINHFSFEIFFGQLLLKFGDFFWSHWPRCSVMMHSDWFKNSHVTWNIQSGHFLSVNHS